MRRAGNDGRGGGSLRYKVAAVAAAVIAGTGLAGAVGPRRPGREQRGFAAEHSDFVPLEGQGDAEVVSVAVPAGSCAVFGKASITSFEPASVGVTCSLSTPPSPPSR